MQNPQMQKEDHRIRVAAERRERMRRRLFESTLLLVAEKGPAATSIDDVIQSAEVSRGTFYKYFDTPELLYEELALLLAREMVLMAEPAVLQLKDPAERVAAGMRLVIHLAVANRQVGGFVVRLGWPGGVNLHALEEFVQRDLKDGIAQQRFMDMPLRLGLNIVSMTVFGAIHAMLAPRAPRGFVEQAVASALRALGIKSQEALRISTMELPAPRALEDGLLIPDVLVPGKKASASRARRDSARQDKGST